MRLQRLGNLFPKRCTSSNDVRLKVDAPDSDEEDSSASLSDNGEWDTGTHAEGDSDGVMAMAAAYLFANYWVAVAFVCGGVLMVCGLALGSVEGRPERFTLTRVGLCLTGYILMGGLLSVILVRLILSGITMISTCSPKRKHFVAVLSYYMGGASRPLAGCIWVVYSLVGVALASSTFVTDPPASWDTYTLYLNGIFTVLGLIFLSQTITNLSSFYLAQDFGTRTYQVRLDTTLFNEQVLTAILGTQHPVFNALYERRRSIQSLESPNPEFWQRAIRYVNVTHVDGNPTIKARHVPRKPGSKDHLIRPANMTAKRIFRRLFGLSQAINMLAKRDHSSPITAAEENVEPTGEKDEEPAEALQRRNSASDMFDILRPSSQLRDEPRAVDDNSLVSPSHHIDNVPQPVEPLDYDIVVASPPPTTKVEALPKGNSWKTLGLKDSLSKRGLASSVSVASVSTRGDYSNDYTVKSWSSKSNRIYREDTFTVLEQLNFPADLDKERVWALLDPKDTGFFTLPRLRRIVHGMYKDRYSLSLTLQDSQHVIKAMDAMILSICLVVVTLIALSIFSKDNVQLIASLVSAIVAWSFVFGQSVSTSFNNLVFLFAVHPFDVGDHVEMDEIRYDVLRIRLFTTDLLRYDGAFLRMQNSHIMASKSLINFTTSQNHGIPIPFYIPVGNMTRDLLKSLQKSFEQYVVDNPGRVNMMWCTARGLAHPLEPNRGGMVQELHNVTHCKLVLWAGFVASYDNLIHMLDEQSEIVSFLCEVLRAHGISKPIVSMGFGAADHGGHPENDIRSV